MANSKRALRIDAADNVAVMLESVKAGELIEIDGVEGTIVAPMDVNLPHKIACRDIKKGEPVIKYGCEIGIATEDIKQGVHVHAHNIFFDENEIAADDKRY